MTLDHTTPWNPWTYAGWKIEHLPVKPGLRDTWMATSPDFHYDECEGFEDITGSFITAPDRMALIAEIDRSMM